MSSQESQKPLTDWIPTPEFEEYRERFRGHFEMQRREDGVLFVCMHTLGGEVQWNAQLHRAIWQLFRTIGSDPKNEVLIFTAKGDNWMRGFDTASWAEIEEPAMGGDPKRATYENMFYDGRQMLISLIHDVEFPTICAFPGFGFHTEIGLMMDIVIASDDAIILDDHYGFGLVPGDGIHSCFIELMGIRRASYAMWMGKPIDAKTALDWGLVSELVPKENLIERAYEIADRLMSQPRVTRRMTTQVFRRQWKQRIVNDLDGAFGMEMYVDLATEERHTDEKAQAIIDAQGSELGFLREGRKEGMKFKS